MAVTQTDQGTSLKLIARTLLQSGRRVGIAQLTRTLKQWMGELGTEPEDALYNRLSLVMNDKATRLSLVQPGEIPDGWVELVEFGGFGNSHVGSSHVAYLILPNKSRVVCASRAFGWFLSATRPDDFPISLPITQASARRILAAVLSEEEGERIWP